MQHVLASLVAATTTLGFASPAFAQFEWGASCDDGHGSFQQNIAHQAGTQVGHIPAGKDKVHIRLTSNRDVGPSARGHDLRRSDRGPGRTVF